MSRYIVASTSFDATHNDPLESPHLHGHRFEVEVTEQTEISTDILKNLVDICSELHHHSLDEMLTGGSQSGQGIASWIMERLLINHPKIVRLELWWDPRLRYAVTRDLR